ncbi:hypothetical protein DFS34DRAFT_650296 [Phlyctochytrium arcticum]|nr:hypothetical protein DFS34DRAFT_650296 [Phlyctochytrium arcticum]
MVLKALTLLATACGLVLSVSAANITVTCPSQTQSPAACPQTLPFTSPLSLVATYTPTTVNTIILNATFSYTLTIPSSPNPQQLSYNTTLSRSSPNVNDTGTVSTFPFLIDLPRQLTLSAPFTAQSSLRARIFYTEVKKHDGSFSGAGAEEVLVLAVTPTIPTSTSGSTGTPSPGSGTPPSEAPRSVLVLGSGAAPTPPPSAVGNAIVAGVAAVAGAAFFI